MNNNMLNLDNILNIDIHSIYVLFSRNTVI